MASPERNLWKCHILLFDPTRVPDGIELSADPILNARPHVYEESVHRRSGVRRCD